MSSKRKTAGAKLLGRKRLPSKTVQRMHALPDKLFQFVYAVANDSLADGYTRHNEKKLHASSKKQNARFSNDTLTLLRAWFEEDVVSFCAEPQLHRFMAWAERNEERIYREWPLDHAKELWDSAWMAISSDQFRSEIEQASRAMITMQQFIDRYKLVLELEGLQKFDLIES